MINPIRLLGLEVQSFDEITSDLLKQSKKKLLAEFELDEDNSLVINAKIIHKSTAIEVLKDFEDNLYFHYLIHTNRYLCTFLSHGRLDYFYMSNNDENIQGNEFVNFISPYFAQVFGDVLLHATKEGNARKISALISGKILVNSQHIDSCYQPTYEYIKSHKVNKLSKIHSQLRKKDFDRYKLKEVPWDQLLEIDVDTLNTLPDYFSELRNDLADSVIGISIEINNHYDLCDIAYQGMKSIKDLSISHSKKEHYIENFAIIEKNYKQLYSQKYSHIISKYENFRNIISSIIDRANSGNMDISRIDYYLKDCDFRELNSLTKENVELRNSVAARLLNLAIAIWNNYHEIDVVTNIIENLIPLNIELEKRQKIEEQVESFNKIKIQAEQDKRNYKLISEELHNIKINLKYSTQSENEIIERVHELLNHETLLSVKDWYSDNYRNALVNDILDILKLSTSEDWEQKLVIPITSELRILIQCDSEISEIFQAFQVHHDFNRKTQKNTNVHTDNTTNETVKVNVKRVVDAPGQPDLPDASQTNYWGLVIVIFVVMIVIFLLYKFFTVTGSLL